MSTPEPPLALSVSVDVCLLDFIQPRFKFCFRSAVISLFVTVPSPLPKAVSDVYLSLVLNVTV